MMGNKSDNDFTLQNELLAKISLVVQTLDQIDEILDKTPQEQSRCDSLKSDYLHLYEGYDLDETQMINISKKLHDICVERRNWNNIAIISKTYREHLSKLVWSKQRPFFNQMMENTVKNLNLDYKDRVLTEDEKQKLLGGEQQKEISIEDAVKIDGKYKRASKELKEMILNRISNGENPRDVAAEYNIPYPTVYNWRKKLCQSSVS